MRAFSVTDAKLIEEMQMTILYLANTTKQHHLFNYRLPENSQLFQVTIPAGGQVKLPHEDLSIDQLGYVIKQHEQYGLIDQKNIISMRAYTGLCYSIGKEIDMRRVRHAIEKNDEYLNEGASKMIGENLAAADKVVADATGGHAGVASLEIEEKIPASAGRKPMTTRKKIAGRNTPDNQE